MVATSVLIFWVSTLIQLGVILTRRTGHYEFPFFFTLTSLMYFGIQLSLFSATEGYKYGVEISGFVVASITANLAVHFGFNRAKQKFSRRNELTITTPRSLFPLLLLSILTTLGFLSFFQLAAMAGGVSHMFDGSGSSIVWRDEAVRHTFAVQNLLFVFPIALFFWKRCNSHAFLFLAIIALLIPIANAFLLNRRFVFFLLATTLFLFLYFQYRIIMPKIFLSVAVPIALAVVTLFPYMRAGAPLSDVLAKKNVTGIQLLIGQHYGEVKNGAIALASSFRSFEHGYGAGFIKQVFKDFVPSSVIGRDLKTEILGEDSLRQITYENYGYVIPGHEFITGIGTAFFQFGFLSVVMWYMIGHAFGKQWHRASVGGSLRSQIMYTAMVPAGLMALYYDPTAALSQAIKVWVIVQLTFLFSRIVLRRGKPLHHRSQLSGRDRKYARQLGSENR